MWAFHFHTITYWIILSTFSVLESNAVCSSKYGAEPCPYVPAPPGHTPPCARPGDTFCENIEHYPMQQIRYLIDKWGYDYSTLFNDEARNDFNSYFSQPDYTYSHPPTYGYTYPEPEPIHIPKPSQGPFTPQQTSNKYIPPAPPLPPVTANGRRFNYTEGFSGYPDRRPLSKYTGFLQGNHLNQPTHRGHPPYAYFAPPQGNAYTYFDPNSWWRYNRENKNYLSRSKRSSTKPNPTISPDFSEFIDANVSNFSNYSEAKTEKNTPGSIGKHHRDKRQSVLGGPQQLCPTRSQFITPQAALNNQGNWMYVVNVQDQDAKYTQLVKSESCVSQTCSGLCSIPTGYTARCEQRYVQKRLVALEGGGQNLYTDVFWFPSCCICTFTPG